VSFGPNPTTEGDRMAFMFKLEQEDGTPADPTRAAGSTCERDLASSFAKS
jgi:hypothetical protein